MCRFRFPARGLRRLHGPLQIHRIKQRQHAPQSQFQRHARRHQIDQINVVEASIDGGPWETVETLPARTYQTNISVGIPVSSSGIHDIDIRTADLRTGVVSSVFHGETDGPTASDPGVSGLVFSDTNANGDLG